MSSDSSSENWYAEFTRRVGVSGVLGAGNGCTLGGWALFVADGGVVILAASIFGRLGGGVSLFEEVVVFPASERDIKALVTAEPQQGE